MLYLGKRPPIYIYYLKGGLYAASYIWYLLRFEMASLYLIVTPVSCKIKLNDMKLILFSSSCVCSESIFTISRHKYLSSLKLRKTILQMEIVWINETVSMLKYIAIKLFSLYIKTSHTLNINFTIKTYN